MDRATVIRMANEAGWNTVKEGYSSPQFLEMLERFAELVAAHEREALRQLADDLSIATATGNLDLVSEHIQKLTAAIRARAAPGES